MGAGTKDLRELAVLSAPLIAGHAGNQLMALVDTAMVAPLGAAALGGTGIGNGLYFALTILGLGCVLGMDPVIAQALGAGETTRARRIFWQGIRVAVLVGVPLTLAVALVPLLLPVLRVDEATAEQARRYLLGRLPNVLPFLLFAASRAYVQALGTTRPIVVAMIVANLTNLVGNAFLIYGDDFLAWAGLPRVGLPAMGTFGAGLSSALSQICALGVMAYAVRAIPAPADPDRRKRDAAVERNILRIGLPVGLQMLAEVGAFASAGVLAGKISANAAAGHQIAIALASFTFTVTLGVSAASSVLVGRAVGRGDTAAARRAGVLSFVVAAAFMLVAAGVFLAIPRQLASLMAPTEDVVRATVPLLMIAAVFQISDGVQAVGAGALRGAGDTRSGLYANVVGHYFVGLPLAAILAFVLGHGAPGLWWGLSAGLTAVAAWLVLRFLHISSKPIRRV